jgi:hypothetical protein
VSIDYEYTTVDVDILTHPKALAAGLEAMGLWLWGQAWSHKTGANGKIPRHVIVLAWGATRAVVDKLAKRLVSAGLWLETPDGWEVWNYGKKNQSAEEKERRRQQGRERMARFRDRSRNASGNAQSDASPNRGVTCLDAAPVNDPDLISSGGESERGSPPTEQTPPDWWDDVCETVEAQTGATLSRGAAWLRYYGHRATHGKRIAKPDAVYWLTTVDAREAAKDREERRRQAERDAKFDARSRAGPGSNEPQKLTQAEQEDLAKRIPMRRSNRGAA